MFSQSCLGKFLYAATCVDIVQPVVHVMTAMFVVLSYYSCELCVNISVFKVKECSHLRETDPRTTLLSLLSGHKGKRI